MTNRRLIISVVGLTNASMTMFILTLLALESYNNDNDNNNNNNTNNDDDDDNNDNTTINKMVSLSYPWKFHIYNRCQNLHYNHQLQLVRHY